MSRIREETDQSINRQKMEGLYFKCINLAKDAEEKGDRVLSESYYQRAEYYLHAMNYPDDSVSTVTPSIRQSHSDTQVEPQGGKVLPYRSTFLRRNRRNFQG